MTSQIIDTRTKVGMDYANMEARVSIDATQGVPADALLAGAIQKLQSHFSLPNDK